MIRCGNDRITYIYERYQSEGVGIIIIVLTLIPTFAISIVR